MIRRLLLGKNNIKKIVSNNRGSAMITALVVGIIVFAFCLSMLLVSYTLFAQVSRNQVQLGCKTLALSAAEELEEELDDDGSEISVYLKDKLKSFDESDDENINRNVELRLDGTEAFDYYDVKVSFELISKSEVEMYVACYKDYGNFRDVQSYTVHKTLRLK